MLATREVEVEEVATLHPRGVYFIDGVGNGINKRYAKLGLCLLQRKIWYRKKMTQGQRLRMVF